MAAFDRILSGIPEMDQALDNIRLGITWYGGYLTWRNFDISANLM